MAKINKKLRKSPLLRNFFTNNAVRTKKSNDYTER